MQAVTEVRGCSAVLGCGGQAAELVTTEAVILSVAVQATPR